VTELKRKYHCKYTYHRYIYACIYKRIFTKWGEKVFFIVWNSNNDNHIVFIYFKYKTHYKCFLVYGFIKILKYKSTLFKFHRHNNLFCYILTFYTCEFVLNFLHYFEQLFEYFKHSYTHFHTFFHPHVYQKYSNNITQTSLPNTPKYLESLFQLKNFPFWGKHFNAFSSFELSKRGVFGKLETQFFFVELWSREHAHMHMF